MTRAELHRRADARYLTATRLAWAVSAVVVVFFVLGVVRHDPQTMLVGAAVTAPMVAVDVALGISAARIERQAREVGQ